MKEQWIIHASLPAWHFTINKIQREQNQWGREKEGGGGEYEIDCTLGVKRRGGGKKIINYVLELAYT